MKQRVIAFIPAYNEAARLGEVVKKTLPYVSQVMVIDDGSADQTAEVARAGGASVYRHEQNRGKGAAIQSALECFRQTDAEFAILLDADGQHDPDEIPKFVAAAESSGADVVVGTRMGDTQRMPWLRLQTNRFTSWLTARAAGQKIPDSQCGYRLLRRTVLPDLRFATRHYETETEMLIQAARAGHKIASVPIRTIYAGQTSHIRPLRDTVRFFKLVRKYW